MIALTLQASKVPAGLLNKVGVASGVLLRKGTAWPPGMPWKSAFSDNCFTAVQASDVLAGLLKKAGVVDCMLPKGVTWPPGVIPCKRLNA